MSEESKKEHKKKYMQEYWKKHKKEKKAYMKEYFQNLPEEKKKSRNEYMKKWYRENKEIRKSYYESHKKEHIDYMRSYQKNNIENNIEFLINEGLLTDCIICGFPKEKFAAIDFHHINQGNKKSLVSKLLDKPNKDKLLEEASKCVCMCRNCHMLYHGGDEEVIKNFDRYLKLTGGER